MLIETQQEAELIDRLRTEARQNPTVFKLLELLYDHIDFQLGEPCLICKNRDRLRELETTLLAASFVVAETPESES